MRIRRVPVGCFPPVKLPATGRTPRASADGRTGTARQRRAPAAGLVGKRLAAAAHPVAVRVDPDRQGIGPRELLAALTDSGVAVGGASPYMALYVALNSASGSFERTGRGRYRWTDPGGS